jgi:hypothetical protein
MDKFKESLEDLTIFTVETFMQALETLEDMD